MTVVFTDAPEHQPKSHIEPTESHAIYDWIYGAVHKEKHE